MPLAPTTNNPDDRGNPDDDVLARESYWKDVLLSRQFGLNRN